MHQAKENVPDIRDNEQGRPFGGQLREQLFVPIDKELVQGVKRGCGFFVMLRRQIQFLGRFILSCFVPEFILQGLFEALPVTAMRRREGP